MILATAAAFDVDERWLVGNIRYQDMPSTTGDIIIRPLHESDSMEELTSLLHRAYKYLADLGLKFLATHQDVETTRHRAQAGDCFVATLDGRLVGTITFYHPGAHSKCPYYAHPDVCHVGQLAVEPALQRQGLANRLMDRVEAHARDRGYTEIALDTAEPARHLIEWYTRRGYRFVAHQQWEVTNYRSVVMAKTLNTNK